MKSYKVKKLSLYITSSGSISPTVFGKKNNVAPKELTPEAGPKGSGTDLDQQRVPEPQGALQVLPEGVIQEAGPRDLAVLVLVHDELRGLPRGVDDQRVPEGEARQQVVGGSREHRTRGGRRCRARQGRRRGCLHSGAVSRLRMRTTLTGHECYAGLWLEALSAEHPRLKRLLWVPLERGRDVPLPTAAPRPDAYKELPCRCPSRSQTLPV